MSNRKYRVQRKEDDSNRWFTLALTDITITCDSDARRLIEVFRDCTGGTYRAQVQHGRAWIPVMLT